MKPGVKLKHDGGGMIMDRDTISDTYCCESRFWFETPYASLIYASVLSEEDVTGGRSHAACQMCGPTTVELLVHAVDVRALRAALNTWLRLFSVATEMCELSEVQR
ncbi:MAG: hypothetical protein LBV40_08400 [Methanomicrobiales archaeon]|jgi:KEOPS complex subunit Pcc1|nr:hypothetical protein [Methanomicrobiales archaeon]